jgi:hypothetical protein
MPSEIQHLLDDLEVDVARVNLEPAVTLRARADRRSRRSMWAGAVAVLAVIGLVPGGIATLRGSGIGPADPLASTAPAMRTPARVKNVVTVFLTLDLTDAQRQVIEARLERLGGVSEIQFIDRQHAWEQFKLMYQNAPDLLESTPMESMPQYFRFILADPAGYDAIATEVGRLPGVETTSLNRLLDPPTACPPLLSEIDSALPTVDAIKLEIRPAANHVELAAAAVAELRRRGFGEVGDGNFAGKSGDDVTVITFGPAGVGAAWVVRAFLVGPVELRYLGSWADAAVDVRLGAKFTRVATPTEVNQTLAMNGPPRVLPDMCPAPR